MAGNSFYPSLSQWARGDDRGEDRKMVDRKMGNNNMR
jgi:hypothetical protein